MISDVKVSRSAEETAAALADELAEMIRGFGEDRTFNIALSGGSTPKLLFQALAGRHGDSIDWLKVNFFWADERCVPPDDPESNYGMTWQALVERIQIPAVNVHRIRGEEEPVSEALRYSEVIETLVPRKNSLPFFDVILLGLGEDGHTASIFPGSESLFDAVEMCAVAINPYSGQKRITITGRIINNAGIVIFLVSGKNKAAIVREIIGREDPARYPAGFVAPNNGRIIWYLDADAASLIHIR